jgi:hypothetical protein
MFFDLFGFGPNTYLKRASTLLQEAQMARIEHQAAAEHHSALARMYTERVKRLEAEVYRSRPIAEDEDPLSHPGELASLYSLDKKRGKALSSN